MKIMSFNSDLNKKAIEVTFSRTMRLFQKKNQTEGLSV